MRNLLATARQAAQRWTVLRTVHLSCEASLGGCSAMAYVRVLEHFVFMSGLLLLHLEVQAADSAVQQLQQFLGDYSCHPKSPGPDIVTFSLNLIEWCHDGSSPLLTCEHSASWISRCSTALRQPFTPPAAAPDGVS